VHKLIVPIAVLAAAVTPAAAQRPAPPTNQTNFQRDTASMLRARVASIDIRIDMLRDRQILSAADAQELHGTARTLERRLHGMSRRDASDIETALAQLERRVGYGMEDARWGRHAYSVGEDRHIDNQPYRGGRDSDYRHFDRYTAPPVDRWHDPFDRGGGL